MARISIHEALFSETMKDSKPQVSNFIVPVLSSSCLHFRQPLQNVVSVEPYQFAHFYMRNAPLMRPLVGSELFNILSVEIRKHPYVIVENFTF